MHRSLFAFGLIIFSLFLMGAPPQETPDTMTETSLDHFVAGEVNEPVACKANSEQRYSLYLPSAYTPQRQWPVIFAFDAAARYKIPLNLYQESAEAYGYILVVSHNVQNGPGNLVNQAIFELWNDTRQRLSLDLKRVYATGFSGGARAASRFHVLTGQSLAGIIACGAGTSPILKDLKELKPALFYGIVGFLDSNYKELLTLDKHLDDAGVRHHMEFVDHDHRWPPKLAIERAVAWMVIDEIKKELRPKDPTIIRRLHQKLLGYVHNLILSQRPYFAAKACDDLAAHCKTLTDVSELEQKSTQLKESEQYKDFTASEWDRLKKEQILTQNTIAVIDAMENAGKKRINLKDVVKNLHIEELKKDSQSTDFFTAAMAKRTLSSIRTQIGTKAGQYMRDNQYQPAVLYFEILIAADPTNPFNLYNLACVHAKARNAKNAIKYLKASIKHGFKDHAHMLKDSDLDNIRNEKAFKELMQTLK